MSAWDSLQGAIAGEVVLPGSPEYEVVRKPAIARFHDVRPQAVVRCATPEDVSEAVAFARRAGIATAARSGGHCFAGRSSTEGMVIDVAPMGATAVDGGVATIGAGARLGAVYDALAPHGLTIPAGCGPTVGIAGLTLGGGLGIMGRAHGLTSDHLIGAQVVLRDGRILETDEHHEPELLWALRGAGGSRLGVVTSLTFRTLPAPAATSFLCTWPHAVALAVIEAWQEWAPGAPDELAASLLVSASDGPPTVRLLGAMLGTEADTVALLQALVDQAGADPSTTTTTHASYRDTKRHLAGLGGTDDDEGAHLYSKSEFFRRGLPAETIAALVEHLVNGPGTRELDFTPWSGAYNRVPPDATAFVHRRERFLLKHAVVADPARAPAARRWLHRSWELVHPYGSGGVYPNFPDPDVGDRAYLGGNRERLQRVAMTFSAPGRLTRDRHP
jgi:hypothetical protein